MPCTEANPNIFYVATAHGGVWKTVNNGSTFEAQFQDEGPLSIGALAVSQSNPDLVYVAPQGWRPMAGIGPTEQTMRTHAEAKAQTPKAIADASLAKYNITLTVPAQVNGADAKKRTQ